MDIALSRRVFLKCDVGVGKDKHDAEEELEIKDGQMRLRTTFLV